MAELQEQLHAILGDPEAMGQITAIARALTGGASAPGGPPRQAPDVHEAEFVPVEDPPPEEPRSGAEQSPDLSSLLGMLGTDMDPRLLRIALRVFSEYSARDDEKAALLSALKPFLRKERLEKIEKAEKVARLSRGVRLAIQLLKEEGEGHV